MRQYRYSRKGWLTAVDALVAVKDPGQPTLAIVLRETFRSSGIHCCFQPSDQLRTHTTKGILN
jgi:hypothetical protein